MGQGGIRMRNPGSRVETMTGEVNETKCVGSPRNQEGKSCPFGSSQVVAKIPQVSGHKKGSLSEGQSQQLVRAEADGTSFDVPSTSLILETEVVDLA